MCRSLFSLSLFIFPHHNITNQGFFSLFDSPFLPLSLRVIIKLLFPPIPSAIPFNSSFFSSTVIILLLPRAPTIIPKGLFKGFRCWNSRFGVFMRAEITWKTRRWNSVSVSPWRSSCACQKDQRFDEREVDFITARFFLLFCAIEEQKFWQYVYGVQWKEYPLFPSRLSNLYNVV